MSKITSHILDTSRGMPAAGVDVRLEHNAGDIERVDWMFVGSGVTNGDGRIADLTTGPLKTGHYRISFMVADYFDNQKIKTFYPVIRIEFQIDDASQHFHVPLLLNPFGYSTYRGS